MLDRSVARTTSLETSQTEVDGRVCASEIVSLWKLKTHVCAIDCNFIVCAMCVCTCQSMTSTLLLHKFSSVTDRFTLQVPNCFVFSPFFIVFFSCRRQCRCVGPTHIQCQCVDACACRIQCHARLLLAIRLLTEHIFFRSIDNSMTKRPSERQRESAYEWNTNRADRIDFLTTIFGPVCPSKSESG